MDRKTLEEKMEGDANALLSPNSSIRLGRVGEICARRVLCDNGYSLIDVNWRCSRGEIDIVAYDSIRHEIALIEVKTRLGRQCGDGFEAVDRKKLRKLRGLAGIWIEQNQPECDVRIDVVSVGVEDGILQVSHMQGVD